MPVAVASAMGLHQVPGLSVMDALVSNLARQQLLLVLDNCEHLLDEAAEFCAAVLLAADDVRILATSREPLGLPGEARFRLPPLTLPGQSRSGDALPSEAEALFIERVHQLDPQLILDDNSNTVVAQLVQRLDGMPLAIELAAARVESLGLVQLLDRLDDRFRLLVSAHRTVAARQRSLEATFDWSYHLLTEAEQRVLRRLSVLPGPFTLDAAEAVAGPDAAPAVLHLVDCSLLMPPRAGSDDRARYSMLEALRTYGREQMKNTGEEDEAARAVAAHALDVVKQAATEMARHDGEVLAARWLDAEDAAIHQGLAWALTHSPPDALQLAVALAPWWRLRGRWVEGYALLQHAVERTGPDVDAWYSGHVWLGRLGEATSDYDTVLDYYSVAVDALMDGPPSFNVVDSLAGRAYALRNLGRLSDAAVDASNALGLARRIGYASGEVMALTELSLAACYADDGEDSLEWIRQAQRIDKDQIPGWIARYCDLALLFTLMNFDALNAPTEEYARALAQARTAGDLSGQADCSYLMAVLALETGRLGDARLHLRETLELASNIGFRLRMIDTIDECGYLCAMAGRYTEAVTLWSARDIHQFQATGGFVDTPHEKNRRRPQWHNAARALGSQKLSAAKDRGTALTLAAAVELAMMTSGDLQTPPRPAGPGKLSNRERELVALVAQGQTDFQISKQLVISVSTVRTHLDRIRDKSGCRRRADLTRLALQEGIV